MELHQIKDQGAEPPRVVLPMPEADLMGRIHSARTIGEISAVVADSPQSIEAWAALAKLHEEAEDGAEGLVSAYACYRVGYHRGLDALRQSGWRGTQLVRWEDVSNRGFLRCLAGLGRLAGRIGEQDEADRCADFLARLDPT
ncbi:MAG: DUF3151 family protein [bacterium]|nr:DUF3151 family protein [bacterium]